MPKPARSLLQIIEVLFNYINYGQAPGGEANRRRVDVQSLTHLVETRSDPERAPFPKFHMLHFCIQDLLKQHPTFTLAQAEEEPLAAVGKVESFAEDWWHGSAIIGVNEKGGPDAVLPPDGVPPPPGMLQRWRPSGRCKPYLCEVRGALLVLYRVKTFTSSASLRGTFYVVLPGAELQLLDSLYATDFARQLARERNSSGLELQTTDGRTEYLLAKTAKETTRWMDFLTSRSQQWDAGFVSHYLGWGFISSCWRRLLCVLDRPNRRLLGFSQVRNYAEGLKPDYCWELPSNANVYAFDAEKRLLSVAPSGFEIELSDEQRLQFSCDSVQHLHRWLEELRKCLQPPILTDFLSESNDPVRPRRMTGAMTGTAAPLREAELFDLFAEQSPSKPSTAKNLSFSVVEAGPSLPSTPSGHRPEQLRKRLMLSVGAVEGEPDTPREKSVERANSDDEVPPRAALVATSSFCALGDLTKPEQVPDALSQLHQLEVELQGVVETWSRTLLATEADGRALLRSFGLNAQPETLHDASQQLLQALSTFQQQLRVAWAEVEQHRAGRPCASPRKPLGHAVRADAEAKPEAALAEHDASCGGSASASSDATVSDAEECASFVNSKRRPGPQSCRPMQTSVMEGSDEEWIQAELEPQAKSAPSAPSPAAPKKGGKGPKGGKGVPKQASALPLGRRLSVRMLTPGEAALAEEEEPGEVEVDLEALRHTFGPAASSKQPPSSNSRVTQELGVELLPRREAQNPIAMVGARRDAPVQKQKQSTGRGDSVCPGQTPAKGEGRSTRRRVDVQSLTHLVETRSDPGRAPFPKFHMLHFCIKDLLKQHPDFTMAQELRHLSDASVVNLAHEKLALGRLQEDLQFVKTELHSHREDYQKALGVAEYYEVLFRHWGEQIRAMQAERQRKIAETVETKVAAVHEVASEEATCSSANAGCAEKHAVRSPECPVEKAPSLAPSLCGLGGFFRGLTKKEEKVPDALSQLERLEVEMDRVVVQWTKTLAATEADCRALLRFFRLGGTTVDAELHEASQQLLQALSTFQQQLRVAWTEVEHHEKPKSSPRRREKLGEAPDTESEETASESEKSFVKSLKRLAPRGERVAGRGPR
eukprot:g9269.t1